MQIQSQIQCANESITFVGSTFLPVGKTVFEMRLVSCNANVLWCHRTKDILNKTQLV